MPAKRLAASNLAAIEEGSHDPASPVHRHQRGHPRERGCVELASDALLVNAPSQKVHRAIGFSETERVVFFSKSPAIPQANDACGFARTGSLLA